MGSVCRWPHARIQIHPVLPGINLARDRDPPPIHKVFLQCVLKFCSWTSLGNTISTVAKQPLPPTDSRPFCTLRCCSSRQAGLGTMCVYVCLCVCVCACVSVCACKRTRCKGYNGASDGRQHVPGGIFAQRPRFWSSRNLNPSVLSLLDEATLMEKRLGLQVFRWVDS